MTALEESASNYVNFKPLQNSSFRTPPGDAKRHSEFLLNLTNGLVDTYSRCSNSFGYSLNHAPRRVLTKLAKGVHNGGYDNSEHDYICKVGDKIVNPDGRTYEILERLGHGTFGQVLKCHDSSSTAPIALKIIKNKPAYFHQALMEVRILRMLKDEFDPEDDKRLVRMLDYFVYRKHLCIAFELLSVNLYDVLKQNSFRGVSMALIRVLTEQLLKAMRCLREACVIHCDLKPENVLLSNMQHTRIKLIDFGSACFENHTVYSYIQSRFYRSPEVLLGLPYTSAIDMWSLGCICAELFLGLPIFPGHSEYDQVCRIIEVLDYPPSHMLDIGTNTRRYFKRVEEPKELSGAGKDAVVSGDSTSAVSRGRMPWHSPSHEEASAPVCRGEESDDEPEPSERDSMTSPPGQGMELPPGDDSSHEGEPAPVVMADDDEGDDLVADSPPASAAKPDSIAGGSDTTPSKENLRRTDSFLDLIKRQFGMTSDEPPTSTDEPIAEEGSTTEAHASGAGASDAAPARERLASQDRGQSAGSTMSTMAESGLDHSRKHAPSGDETGPQDSCQEAAGVQANASGASSMDGPSQSSTAPVSGRGDHGGQAPNSSLPAASSLHVGHQNRRSRGRRRGVRMVWRLKAVDEYERDEHKKEPAPKKYFNFTSLKQMVELVPIKSNLSDSGVVEEEDRRECFLQFLDGVLQMNPDARWTPAQASHHSFITGERYNQNFQPPPDEPVPSFTRISPPGVSRPVPPGEVPRLPAEAMGTFNATAGAFAGGGSARTYNEDVSRQGAGGGNNEAEQPRSAPATSRAPNRNLAPPATSSSSTSGAAMGGSTIVGNSGKSDTDSAPVPVSLPDLAVKSLWGMFPGIPLPDDNPAESYRPPIDNMASEHIRSTARAHMQTDPSGGRSTASPPKACGGAWSVSTGASFCSSASSTGSTPTGGRGRRGQASPYSTGSPFSAGGYPSKGQHPHVSHMPDPAKLGGHSMNRHQLSGTTTTPASSPHGSSVSTAMNVGGYLMGSSVGVQTPHRQGASSVGSGMAMHGRAGGSRDGSRGSSPWHLPSPMSTLSNDSNQLNSSQPSGSDSCGVEYDGAQCNFEDCAFEDPSQSDTPHWRSDSDCATPRSHDAAAQTRTEDGARDPQHARAWDSLESGIARMPMQLGRVPRHMGMAQSPGSTGELSNFRERVGMNESGPVMPRGREAICSMMPHHHEESRGSFPGGGGSGGHGHGRHRTRKHR